MIIRRSFVLVTVFCVLLIALGAAGRAASWVSTRGTGASKPGASLEPGISGDGRYVVFSSLARLLPEDRNSKSDIYLKDRETGLLRLISDERGGDQPVISSSGRYIVFRALDEFPKLRLADMEGTEAPRTISYPFGGGTSFRTADSAVISPDGRFVNFAFRPISGFNNATDPQLCVNDTFAGDRLSASASNASDFSLDTLGRSAMTGNGNVFFFETSDRLLPADTNDEQDIYMASRGSNFVRRLSATEAGLPEEGGVRDPVTTPGGETVFFISDRRLRSTDTDERATIYRSTSSDNYATPQPVPTSVTPIALSRQATSDGRFLVFLGRAASGPPQPYILKLSTGEVTPLAPSAVSPLGAPVLSADSGTIAFASTAALAHPDLNGEPDVFVVRNPDKEARIATPVVTLTNPPDGFIGTEGSAITFTASAISPDSPAQFTAIEVDGREITRVNGGSFSAGLFLNRGVHRVRAVTLNRAGISGRSEEIQVTVRIPANQLRLTNVTNLTQAIKAGGVTDFAGIIGIDNTTAATRAPLQIVLVERPTAMTWEFFGDENSVPIGDERLLGEIEVPSVAGNSVIGVDIRGTASQAVPLGAGFEGLGWTVVARLRELVGGSWVTRSELSFLEVRPRLDENTPGPNGGIPVPGTGPGAPPFNPQLLQTLEIQGPNKVAGTASAFYKATAVFNTGPAPCTPVWEILDGGPATISAAGVLKAGNVSTSATINIRATFSGTTQTFPVVITPVKPRVSVKASKPLAGELGEPGAFKIVRSPAANTALDVTYKITGKAFPGSDYVALSGTARIPAGAASVSLPVQPLDDAVAEGREKVVLTLQSSEVHRLGTARSATVTIEDDEAVQPGQPDVVLMLKQKSVGESEFGFESSEQQLFARGRIKKTTVFQCLFVNRTLASETFTISGGGDFLGFKVQYFLGDLDVTADVVNGTFQFDDVAPGDTTSLTLKITPTASTPRGSVIRCVVRAQSGFGLNDTAEAVVTRVR